MSRWNVACAVALSAAMVSTTFAQRDGRRQRPDRPERPGAEQRQRPQPMRMDTDGDGRVSLEEFKAGHAARQARMKENMGDRWDAERAAQRDPEAMFKRIDTDGDGYLSTEELAANRAQWRRNADQQVERRGPRDGKGKEAAAEEVKPRKRDRAQGKDEQVRPKKEKRQKQEMQEKKTKKQQRQKKQRNND